MKNIFLIIMSLFLWSCSSPQLDDYKNTNPTFKFEDFFNNKLVAYGIVFDRSGKMTRHFSVDIDAKWQGNTGIIYEAFLFSDGEESTRTWTITKLDGGVYSGTASDVIGIAEGKVMGSVLTWNYELKIKVDGNEYIVTLDDWMYLLDSKRLFNKTDIIKFGFKMGEVILYIEKK
jgi:hypothetical protein